MGNIYRVTVTRETRDDDGGLIGDETLFELAVANPGMLARIAPTAIAEALDEVPAVVERAPMTLAAPTAGDVAPPRRPRRTKAQMAEDAARQQGATQDEPGPAPVDTSGLDPRGLGEAPTYNPFGTAS